MKDKKFEEKIRSVEKDAWVNFKDITQKFLGNCKDPNYAMIIKKIHKNFQKLGFNMSLKIHFLHSHLGYFSESHHEMSEEQGLYFTKI